MAINKKPAGYVQPHTTEDALAASLSKTAWVDLYIDLYKQTHGDNRSAGEALADAYNRLLVLEDNGIREHSPAATAAWRKWGRQMARTVGDVDVDEDE